MADIKRQAFRLAALRLVAKAPPPDDPPLAVGDRCRLNSGGPICLVVDAAEDLVTIAWKSGETADEFALPRACIRRP